MRITEEERSQQSGLDGCVDVEFEGNIAVVTMRCGENRCNLAFVNKMNEALNKVEQNPNIECMITTGEGRYYSIGLDVAWLGLISTRPDGAGCLLDFRNDHLQKLMMRFLTFPVVTVAAINGHCYAAGEIIALCHDYRIMNSERGWLCLNEVHNGMRFNETMYEILRSILPSGQTFHEAVVLGRKYNGLEAVQAGLCIQATPPAQLLPEAKKVGTKPGNFSRVSLKTMKEDMYENVLKAARSKTPGRDGNMMSKI